MTEGCGGCEAAGLLPVLAVRDAIDLIIWADVGPLRGIDIAITGLQNAKRFFVAAGDEAEQKP